MMSPVSGQLHLVLTRTPGTAWKGNSTFPRLRSNVAAKSQAWKISWIHFCCVNPDAINIYQLRHMSNTNKQILSWSLEGHQDACLQTAAGLEHCGWKSCGFTSAAFMVGWGDSNWFNVLVHDAILLNLRSQSSHRCRFLSLHWVLSFNPNQLSSADLCS